MNTNPHESEAVSKPRSSRGNEAHFSINSEPPHVGCYSSEKGSSEWEFPGHAVLVPSPPLMPEAAEPPKHFVYSYYNHGSPRISDKDLECGDLSPLWPIGRLVGEAEPRSAAWKNSTPLRSTATSRLCKTRTSPRTPKRLRRQSRWDNSCPFVVELKK